MSQGMVSIWLLIKMSFLTSNLIGSLISEDTIAELLGSEEVKAAIMKYIEENLSDDLVDELVKKIFRHPRVKDGIRRIVRKEINKNGLSEK